MIEALAAMISPRRALGDDLAAVGAGAGAEIDDVIGGQDRFLVVLDHDAPCCRRRAGE